MFNENHANGDTVVRGFGRAWEQPLSNIITERNDQMDDTKTYSAYDHDKLEPADSMKIERIISINGLVLGAATGKARGKRGG